MIQNDLYFISSVKSHKLYLTQRHYNRSSQPIYDFLSPESSRPRQNSCSFVIFSTKTLNSFFQDMLIVKLIYADVTRPLPTCS